MNKKPRLVVLGGGNGTSRLLRALLPLLQAGQLDSLHALVHMSDDGGSTGRLREQYNVAAMGDLTRCLMALSPLQGDIRGDEFLRALEHRFAHGDFGGHTVRNMLLTALQMTSSNNIDAALATMARILQVPKYAGVIPTTLTTLTEQVAITFNDADNLLGEGQHSISHRVNLQADPRWEPGAVRVRFAEGDVPLNPRAEVVLREATHIIVAPGHTFGTILPTLALPALTRAVGESMSPIIVVMTLLTTPRQTVGWSGEDFVKVYELYLGRPATAVIANNHFLDQGMVEGQEWVRFAEEKHAYKLMQADVVSTIQQRGQKGDVVPRAIVVHDADKIGQLLKQAIFS